MGLKTLHTASRLANPSDIALNELGLAVNVVRDYNASGSAASTTGSISAGSAVLTITGTVLTGKDAMLNGQGVSIANAGALPTISAPTSLTVTPIGTAGTTSYTYAVAALDGKGGVTAVFSASTTTGNATLSATNYNALTVGAVTDAAGYAWYRTASGGTPATTGFIGITSGATLDDTGLAITTPPVGVPTSAPASALGDLLVTTISSGGGTTSVTLAATATTAVTGAIVNHDDTAAIQAAVTAAGGVAGCQIGDIGDVFLVSSRINVPSNSRLTIDGTVYLVGQANVTMLGIGLISAVSNVTIKGVGALNGNKANQTGTALAGIYANNSSKIRISGITVTQTQAWGFNVVGCNDVVLDGVTGSYNGAANEFAAGSYNCLATKCKFHDVNDEGFAFYGGVYDSAIADCWCYNNAASGISILNDSGQTAACYDIDIHDNHCFDNSNNGIEVDTGTGASLLHYNIQIHGNDCHNNNQANIGGSGGIHIGNGQVVTINDNITHHNGNGSNASYGMALSNTSNHIKVIGNTIYDEGQGGANGIGIDISNNTVTDVLIEDNMIYDDQGTKTMAYCLNGIVGINMIVKNNYLGTTIGASNNFTAATGSVWEGNHGYNPVGHITSPGVPATTVAYTNSNPYTCRVFISSGTVTVIAINGTATGMTSGMVELSPGETITLTYSAAPSWTWFGL
jgi:hypothetical protein